MLAVVQRSRDWSWTCCCLTSCQFNASTPHRIRSDAAWQLLHKGMTHGRCLVGLREPGNPAGQLCKSFSRRTKMRRAESCCQKARKPERSPSWTSDLVVSQQRHRGQASIITCLMQSQNTFWPEKPEPNLRPMQGSQQRAASSRQSAVGNDEKLIHYQN